VWNETKNSADQKDYIVINKLKGNKRRESARDIYWGLFSGMIISVIVVIVVFARLQFDVAHSSIFYIFNRSNILWVCVSGIILSVPVVLFFLLIFLFLYYRMYRPYLVGGKIIFNEDGLDFDFRPILHFFIWNGEIAKIRKVSDPASEWFKSKAKPFGYLDEDTCNDFPENEWVAIDFLKGKDVPLDSLDDTDIYTAYMISQRPRSSRFSTIYFSTPEYDKLVDFFYGDNKPADT